MILDQGFLTGPQRKIRGSQRRNATVFSFNHQMHKQQLPPLWLTKWQSQTRGPQFILNLRIGFLGVGSVKCRCFIRLKCSGEWVTSLDRTQRSSHAKKSEVRNFTWKGEKSTDHRLFAWHVAATDWRPGSITKPTSQSRLSVDAKVVAPTNCA